MKYLPLVVLFLLACNDNRPPRPDLTAPSVAKLQKVCLQYMEDDNCHEGGDKAYKHTSVCDYGYLACEQAGDYMHRGPLGFAHSSMAELQQACIDYMEYERCHNNSIPYKHRYDTSFCEVGAITCRYVDKYVAENGIPIK